MGHSLTVTVPQNGEITLSMRLQEHGSLIHDNKKKHY